MKRAWKALKHAFLLGLLAALERGFWLLPLNGARALGAGLGRLFFAIVPYERRKTIATVGMAFPELEEMARRKLAGDVFAHLGRGGAEFLRFRFLTAQDIARWVVEVEGEEHIFGPFKRGQGVVAVTGHYGHWELLAAWTALHGRVAVVGRQLYDPRVDEALTERRNAKNVTLFQRNTAVRPILRWLKEGGILGVLADQDTGVDSTYVEFFGRPAKTPSGPAVLAQATGAALVTAYCRRRSDGNYKLVYEPAIPVPERREGGTPMDLWPVVQEYARRMEAVIRQEPSQWAFNHARWRSDIRQPSTGWDPKWAAACLEKIESWRKSGRHLLLALAAALALGGCEKPLPAPAAGAAASEPSLMFEGFRARATNNGAKVWEAVAQRARVYQQAQRADAETVDITYYEGGRVASRARADQADVDLKSYDLKASGNVVVRASNGVLLETSRLDWDQESGRASSPARVRVTRKDTVLTGRGFTADRALKDVRVLEDVQVEAASVRSLRGLGPELKR